MKTMAHHFSARPVAPVILLLLACHARAATEDLGNGFWHHGVATPVSTHRGTVATVDGQDRNVVLVWLFDHRGGYALLQIDAVTGASREFAMPFSPGGDCPYASILSSRNRYYTHFNSHFVEFDPAQQAFTFFHATTPQMAMSMTEDDRGVIWSVTYPNTGLASYHPATGAFQDYGSLHRENWLQYPRSIAADDQGWLYIGLGNTSSHILAFDPVAGTTHDLLPAEERTHGCAYVYRDEDGKVYGHHPGEHNWYRFHAGRAERIGRHETRRPREIVSDSQSLFHRNFPNGDRLQECDLVNRVLTVSSVSSGGKSEVSFEYSSEGAHIMGLAAAPDGSICGGTTFPMRFFRYDPAADQWLNRPCYSQWNTIVRQADHFFVGGYPGGFLLEWDPARDWIPTETDNPDSNPRFLAQCAPSIYRPHTLLGHPDGKTIVMGGTPGYGLTGGGLLFWDRDSSTQVLLDHTQLLPEHSAMALVALGHNELLVGTTTAAGTGGEIKADQAELYILNQTTMKVDWRGAALPGAQEYTALSTGPRGLIFGIADRSRVFVFDPSTRQVVHTEDAGARFGPTAYQQGPRVFVPDGDGMTYILFRQGIAAINPDTYAITLVAQSPVPIGLGGDILGGRIYFGSGSHVYSFQVR